MTTIDEIIPGGETGRRRFIRAWISIMLGDEPDKRKAVDFLTFQVFPRWKQRGASGEQDIKVVRYIINEITMSMNMDTDTDNLAIPIRMGGEIGCRTYIKMWITCMILSDDPNGRDIVNHFKKTAGECWTREDMESVNYILGEITESMRMR